MVSLEKLYLNDNQINHIPDSIMKLIKIKKIFIINNDLQFLPMNITVLEKLNVEGNDDLYLTPNQRKSDKLVV